MTSPAFAPTARRQRVLLVMDLIPRGRRTWEAWLLDLAASLHARGSQLCLLLPEAGPDWFLQELESAGGHLRVHPGIRGKFDVPVVRSAIQELQPTSVVVGFYPMLSPAVLGTVRTRPVSAAYYIDQSSLEIPVRTGWKGLATKIRGRVFSRGYRKIITVSDFKADRLVTRLGIHRNRLHRIYNGVPLDRFTPTATESARRNTIVFAGQVAAYKGVSTLLQAYRALAQRWPDCPALEYAGEGPLKESLQEEVVAAGLTGKVQFLGQRQDVPELMMSASCVVIPSEWDEACAFSALEAMAAGRPVITSDAGSLPELMGANGVIFKAKDASALSVALEDVLRGRLSSSSEARAAGLRQRAFEHFTLERMTREYAELLAP
ncbi:MAG: glycosyltransferase family 4 protein [Verrucomicrobium sp.]|nr:glycosyltransferase family 4 protein [Verrucomicrobium sp.]